MERRRPACLQLHCLRRGAGLRRQYRGHQLSLLRQSGHHSRPVFRHAQTRLRHSLCQEQTGRGQYPDFLLQGKTPPAPVLHGRQPHRGGQGRLCPLLALQRQRGCPGFLPDGTKACHAAGGRGDHPDRAFHRRAQRYPPLFRDSRRRFHPYAG